MTTVYNNLHDRPDEIYLKLENLQPIGAFKVRPMGNAMLTVDKNVMRHGAYTASSGNAGLGLAWMADILGISARVYAPDTAPEIASRSLESPGNSP